MTPHDTPRRVIVMGTGLIGTSVALALSGRGVQVLLADLDPEAVRLAVQLGAGEELHDGFLEEPADLAVLAVPPTAVARVLLAAQKRSLARFYTDVASVKERPVRDAGELGCDLTTFVPGHPMAGRERSGPSAARGDLFTGRPWALCPGQEAEPAGVEVTRGMIRACGAVPRMLDAAEHDRMMAVVSHGPHVVSVAIAARLETVSDGTVTMAGPGVQDLTRKAASDPRLWIEILMSNPEPVARVLEDVAHDLTGAATALRASLSAVPGASTGEHVLTGLLERGKAGRARIPGKHGGRTRRYGTVPVLIPDRPGELALLVQAAGVAGINIEDIVIDHTPGRPVGTVELMVKPEDVAPLSCELLARGWSVPSTLA